MNTLNEHNIKDREDPVAGDTWAIGLIGTILLVVTVLALVAFFYNSRGSLVTKTVIEPDRIDVRQLRDSQRQILNDPPRLVEREDLSGAVKQYLAIPIDRAMELVIEQHGGASASALPTQGD